MSAGHPGRHGSGEAVSSARADPPRPRQGAGPTCDPVGSECGAAESFPRPNRVCPRLEVPPKGLFLLDPQSYERIYGPDERGDISRRVDLVGPLQTCDSVRSDSAVLGDVEVIFSGWGAPVFDAELLAAAPALQMVFYGAGSIRRLTPAEFWDRGVRITSAYAANAVPVAEYALSQILFCLKRGWHFAHAIRRDGRYPPKRWVPGAYGSTVGIISLGMVGRCVCELLRPFDLNVVAHDPYAAPGEAAALGVALHPLEEVFRCSDVVSLHTPWLKETEGMITGVHIASMKQCATFINTARGAVVREEEMTDVLTRRPDLQAVLDVTHPEPPVPGSPLYSLPNVVLTPHIAGSMDGECRRMGRYMVEELDRFLRGDPLRWEVTRERAATLA